uniref:Lectin/glucanase superfamily protein n=1 Tax=viral metagenome TaxID=1070528 RepID=A0A6C0AMP7_9ZZZZ
MADAAGGITLSGADALSQVLLGVVLVIVVYIVLATSEFLYKSFTRMYKDRVELFANTYVSGPKMYSVIQDPRIPQSKTIYFSDNQRSGIEFSYSLFTYIRSDTFDNNDTSSLYHILHKGYGKMYPLLGPGIFCWGNKNTLRIFMNCYHTWDNYTDIENIPVDKWFHLTVTCKGNTLFVYINGNLKTKMALSNNTPPYQNYGNVYAFSNRKLTLNSTNTVSLLNDPMFSTDTPGHLNSITFNGPIKGMISRVFYFGYALTYSEIQALLNMGPSRTIEGDVNMSTEYLSDTWWTNKQGP